MQLGVGQVRAAAQVAPGARAVAADVVVDRQLAGADLDAAPPSAVVLDAPPLRPIELALVRLAGELGERLARR